MFVARLVLLVDDDEGKVPKRGKHGRTRTDHDRHFAAINPQPLVNALASGERAVEDGDLVRKAPGELIRELRRQADFRDQNERGLAGCQEMLDGLHVDFSLTAACDAVEENGAEAGGTVDRR